MVDGKRQSNPISREPKPAKANYVKKLEIPSAKLTVVFKAGELPAIDPNDPNFLLVLGSSKVQCKISSKAARKLAIHQHNAILQGRLISQGGGLFLADAGIQFLEPKPAVAEASQEAVQ